MLTFWITVACGTDMLLFGYDQGVFGPSFRPFLMHWLTVSRRSRCHTAIPRVAQPWIETHNSLHCDRDLRCGMLRRGIKRLSHRRASREEEVCLVGNNHSKHWSDPADYGLQSGSNDCWQVSRKRGVLRRTILVGFLVDATSCARKLTASNQSYRWNRQRNKHIDRYSSSFIAIRPILNFSSSRLARRVFQGQLARQTNRHRDDIEHFRLYGKPSDYKACTS